MGVKHMGFEAKAELRKAPGTNARITSEAQKEAVIAVSERRRDLAVVLATVCGVTVVGIEPCKL